MIRNTNNKSSFSVALLSIPVLVLVGCSQSTPQSTSLEKPTSSSNTPVDSGGTSRQSAADTTADTTEELHPHIPGAHGGFIVPIGRDSYHAEAIFEKEGAISLYMLGADESRINEVENQDLVAYAKAANGQEATPIELKPAPQTGDSTGKTSRFAGNLPESLWGQPVEITIPILRIGTDRFRIGFSSQVQAHGGEPMPAKVTSQEEQDLYLTPGGSYTQADIEANGKVTASQKFAGFLATHDLNPKSGDKICPITLTKANAKCAWTIGGKAYEFCCPPCVDEFVKLAKTNPEKIQPPTAYVKQ